MPGTDVNNNTDSSNDHDIIENNTDNSMVMILSSVANKNQFEGSLVFLIILLQTFYYPT